MLDIFNQDAFTIMALTDAIQNIKFVPGRLGQLGYFNTTPVAVTTIAIEKQGDQLVLVPPTPRGAPGTTTEKVKRTLRPFFVPHFEINDAVYAEEVQGVRAMGTEQAVKTVQMMLAQRFYEHQRSMSATEEYARVGAIKGLITYSDGSQLNLFNEFGVTPNATLLFDFSNKKSGALRAYCQGVIRSMAKTLEGLPFTGIRAFCSDSFMDAMMQNDEVRASYLNQIGAAELREAYVRQNNMTYGEFFCFGIMWENYRGYVGSTSYMDDNFCYLVPEGVPGLFRSYYAPADYIETVNTPGVRLYAKQYEMANGKGVHLDVQMNALNICTRPLCLFKGSMTANSTGL
jgi:Phage major capsid protein E